MKKYLFVGDLHIRSENHEEVDILLRELLAICADRVFDAIVLGGDVMHYHERLFTQPLNQALHFIDTLAHITKVYVLVGNHDYINNSQFLTRQHWMNAMKTWRNVVIVDAPISIDDEMFVPYVPPGRLIEAMDTVDKRWNYKEVIFCHQEFRGCKMGAIVSTEGDEWDDEFPLIISGHIHDHQMVGKKIIYPGTPIQHGFADSTVRRVCEVNVEQNNTNVKWIDLNMPRKHVIHCTLQTVREFVDQMEEKLSSTDKVKIKLETSPEEFAVFKKTTDYKTLTSRGVRIQIKAPVVTPCVLSASSVSSVQDTPQFIEILASLVAKDEAIVQHLFTEIVHHKT